MFLFAPFLHFPIFTFHAWYINSYLLFAHWKFMFRILKIFVPHLSRKVEFLNFLQQCFFVLKTNEWHLDGYMEIRIRYLFKIEIRAFNQVKISWMDHRAFSEWRGKSKQEKKEIWYLIREKPENTSRYIWRGHSERILFLLGSGFVEWKQKYKINMWAFPRTNTRALKDDKIRNWVVKYLVSISEICKHFLRILFWE